MAKGVKCAQNQCPLQKKTWPFAPKKQLRSCAWENTYGSRPDPPSRHCKTSTGEGIPAPRGRPYIIYAIYKKNTPIKVKLYKMHLENIYILLLSPFAQENVFSWFEPWPFPPHIISAKLGLFYIEFLDDILDIRGNRTSVTRHRTEVGLVNHHANVGIIFFKKV